MSLLNDEYQNFKGQISFKKICIDDEETWCLYDAGPRVVTSPIIFLPPVSGQADVYFLQLTCLSKLGYRAISIDYPVLWDVKSFCLSFHKLLNTLKLEKVHLFGSAIGGFLAMKYAEFTKASPRVQSIILCNSFTDTSVFCSRIPAIPKGWFWLLPSVLLRKFVMSDFDRRICDKRTKDSIELMKHSLYSMTQEELASRLVVNCTGNYVQPQYLRNVNIMIIEVNDCDAISQEVMEETHKCFPNARVAQIKSGGNFPFLSRYDDVNVFIQVHLNQYMSKLECMPVDKNSDLAHLAREAELMEAPAVSASPKVASLALDPAQGRSVVISPVAQAPSQQDVVIAERTSSEPIPSTSEPIPSTSEPVVELASEVAPSTVPNAAASEDTVAMLENGLPTLNNIVDDTLKPETAVEPRDDISSSLADISPATSESLSSSSRDAETAVPTSENVTLASKAVAATSEVVVPALEEVAATSEEVAATSEVDAATSEVVVPSTESAVPALETAVVISETIFSASGAPVSASKTVASTSEAIFVAAEGRAETSVSDSATSEDLATPKPIQISTSDTAEASLVDGTTVVENTPQLVDATQEASSATIESVEASSFTSKAPDST